MQQIIAEVQRRYHFFFIFPLNASHGKDQRIRKFWQKLLGQNVIFLEDENAVSETIALAIGLTENAISLTEGGRDLSDVGASHKNIKIATEALHLYSGKKELITTGQQLPAINTNEPSKIERL